MYPTLYAKTKTGAIQQWRVWVEDHTVYVEHGRVGGRLQRTPGKIARAVNVGRANELQPADHALQMAEAMHAHKLNRKYALSAEQAEHAVSDDPMLAQKYNERAKHIRWPCDVQPKLDGNRARATWVGEEVQLISRSGIETYELPHIQRALEQVLPRGDELDGELYAHGLSPQTINSLVSKPRPESQAIQYWVYDHPVVAGHRDLPWSSRRAQLVHRLGDGVGPIVHVPAQSVDGPEELEQCLTRYLTDGYEGLMLRNRQGLYAWGQRSNDLQKLKLFDDREYQVLGCKDGQGKMEGCPIWVCQVPGTTLQFDCTMNIPMADQRQMYVQREQYVGQQLVVAHFGTFDSGIPRFPKGVKFRLVQDTSR